MTLEERLQLKMKLKYEMRWNVWHESKTDELRWDKGRIKQEVVKYEARLIAPGNMCRQYDNKKRSDKTICNTINWQIWHNTTGGTNTNEMSCVSDIGWDSHLKPSAALWLRPVMQGRGGLKTVDPNTILDKTRDKSRSTPTEMKWDQISSLIPS